MAKKKSFFERLAGGIRLDENMELEETLVKDKRSKIITIEGGKKDTIKEELDLVEEEEGQLTVDLYQTPTEIVIQTMVSGVQPDNLTITITRDMITIKGKREI